VIAHPALDVDTAVALLGVSRPAARSALEALTRRGCCVPPSSLAPANRDVLADGGSQASSRSAGALTDPAPHPRPRSRRRFRGTVPQVRRSRGTTSQASRSRCDAEPEPLSSRASDSAGARSARRCRRAVGGARCKMSWW
jgi:hypothetical protein